MSITPRADSRKEFSLESPVQVFNINEKLLAVELEVETMVDPAESIDLSVDLQKQVHVVLSQGLYNKLDQLLMTRVNRNSNTINFYSQAGGKPITTLMNGQHKLGSITYPHHSGTLLSSIKIPPIQDNEILYILIDSYPELVTCTDPVMKRQLLEKDMNGLIKHINDASSNMGVNIIFDSAFAITINDFYPNFFHNVFQSMKEGGSMIEFHETSQDKMNSFLCDKLFGKIIGGQTQSFNGIITTKDYTIIDAYSDGNLSISIRGSGLSVNGNGKAKILIIMEKEISDSRLIIQEIHTGQTIFDDDTADCKSFNFSEKYIKLYEFINYNNELSKLTLESKKTVKEHLVENCYKNLEIEFCDLESYTAESELWFTSKLNSRFYEIITNLRINLELIRSRFALERSQSDLFDPRQESIMQRQYTCPPAQRQSTTGLSIYQLGLVPPPPKLQRY